MDRLKTYWPWLCCVILWMILLFLLCSCNRGLKKENERLRQELAQAQLYTPLKRDTIRDTVEVVTQKVVQVEKIKEILSDDDKALLKDVGIKVKELESLQKTSIETHDTVILTVRDTISQTLTYHDAWTDFEYRDKQLKYAIRDSLAIAIKKEYKHKFLFWKWGTKGYELKTVNFNPHSTIKYNTYVKRI